jgi:acetyl-CoA C-acetyltransferase
MRKVSVIGVAQTKFASKRKETSAELCYEAANKALNDSGLTISEIDCVVFGTAPTAFDGIHMQGENVLLATGAKNKPFLNVTCGGATGIFAPIIGYFHIASGKYNTVLVVCEEKMSPPQPHAQGIFLFNYDELWHRQVGINVLRSMSMEMSRYMYETGATKPAIAMVAVKNKGNAMDNPYAQVPARITVEDVLNSPLLTWPLNRLDISPTSDGAAACVLTRVEIAKELKKELILIEGVGWAQASVYFETRGITDYFYLRKSAKMAYEQAKIKNPQKEIDVCEIYDPMTYKECHHAEGLGLCKEKEGWKLALEGISNRDGKLPINPSGGLLGVGNPISAAGMMKFCEIVHQLRGDAGRRQVKKKRLQTGLAHAWGGLFQFSCVVIMRRY